MKKSLSSMTVVTVVDAIVPEMEHLEALARALQNGGVTDFDLVLVANGVEPSVALAVKEFIEAAPDSTAVFLSQSQHADVARLVGVDHAVGDHVLFCSLTADEVAAVPSLLEPLRRGYDLVVAEPVDRQQPPHRPVAEKILLSTYLWAYQMFTGLELEDRPTGLRILSRAAALFVAGHSASEMLLRSRSLGPGFPVTVLPILSAQQPVPVSSASLRSKSRIGIRALIGTTTAPLRVATYMGLLSGIMSLFYAMYVLCILIFKTNVAPGWATISLQLAAMMFVFSVCFTLLSEYVLQIHAANPSRSLRRLVLRILRGPLSRRSTRLNVVDAEGSFHFGAPAELLVRQLKEVP